MFIRRHVLLPAAVLLVAITLGCRSEKTAPATSTAPAATGTARTSATSAPFTDVSPLGLALRFDQQAAMASVRSLADPSFMGRHVGTPGELKGAQFVADAFKAAGLRPGGDAASYSQTFPVTVEEFSATPVLELVGAQGPRRALHLRDDFRPIVTGPAGPGDVTGPGVFGGSGADLSGLDLKGKVLLVVPRGSLLDLAGRARTAGATAVLVTTGMPVLLKGELRPPTANALPMAELSVGGASALLDGSGHTREELNDAIRAGQNLPTFPLAWTVHLAVSVRPPATVDAHNVIGYLPAAAATDRSIIMGGHYEEIGPDPDGVVFPAANDNASGTAVLLEVARLLGTSGFKPTVNVVFVSWSGHEEGLFGSAYYVAHPRFPLAETALYLNVDTVGQGGGSSLSANVSAGPAQLLFDEVRTQLRAQSESFPVDVSQGAGGGSDHVNLARAGVPTVGLAWTGVFTGPAQIHTPADTADSVDPAKLRVTGVTVTLLAALVAQR